jgi:hypothetical protein
MEADILSVGGKEDEEARGERWCRSGLPCSRSPDERRTDRNTHREETEVKLGPPGLA